MVGTLVLVEVERLPRGESAGAEGLVAMVARDGGDVAGSHLALVWRRFDLEHTFGFLEQNIGWTTPRVRHPEQADRWT